MQLTENQIDLIIKFVVLFIFNVGLFHIITCLFRWVKKFIMKIYHGIKRFFIRRNLKKHKGYQNYKNETWYPDGSLYNAETGTFEKANYTKE